MFTESTKKETYFRRDAWDWSKELTKAQDKLVKKFEKKGKNTRWLRRRFYDLRMRYAKKCLRAYAWDMSTSEWVSEKQLDNLLQLKLTFYLDQFLDEYKLLFPRQYCHRMWAALRFVRAGNKLIKELVEELADRPDLLCR